MNELVQQIIEISNQVDELNKCISILKYQEKYKQERNLKIGLVQNQREQRKTDSAK